MGLFSNISKKGTVDQLKALEKLGKSNLDAKTSKLAKSIDASIFVGDKASFTDGSNPLTSIMNDKEIKQLFALLDADGDGTLSEKEVNTLANAGAKGEKGKIDNSDIKELIGAAKESKKNSKVKKNKDGSKTETIKIDDHTERKIKTDKNGKVVSSTVITKGDNGKVKSKATTYPDGSKKEYKYNKDGKVKESKITAANGQVKDTKFDYKDGKKVAAHATIQRPNEKGELVDYKTQEYTYKNGKKSSMTEYDANNKKLSTTKYNYNAKGKLASANKSYADGRTANITYNADGTKKRVLLDADNHVLSNTTYDKNGKKTGKTKYEYDEKGNKTAVYNYSYKDGQLSTRTKYSADGKTVVSEGTYAKGKVLEDGSYTLTRTDRDPKTNNVVGAQELLYNRFGEFQSAKDLDISGMNDKKPGDSTTPATTTPSTPGTTTPATPGTTTPATPETTTPSTVDISHLNAKSNMYGDNLEHVQLHTTVGTFDRLYDPSKAGDSELGQLQGSIEEDNYGKHVLDYEYDADGNRTTNKNSYTKDADGNEIIKRDVGLDGTVDFILKNDKDANGNIKGQYVDLDCDGQYDKYQAWDAKKKQFGELKDI